MRPVFHGAQGAYPFNVVVGGTEAELEASLAAFTVTFPRNPLKGRIEAVFHTSTPTGLQVVQELKEYYLGHANPLFNAALVRAVKEKLREGYAQAAGPLETNIGRYCSYCEGFYAAGLGVEHILPKTPFPHFYLAWENFLLACPSCNSLKGEQPEPGDPVFAPPPVLQDEVEFFARVKGSYTWPQWSPLAFQEQPLRLESKAPGGGWLEVAPNLSVHPQTTIQGENSATRQIFASIAGGPPVQVQVQVTGTTFGANRMIELVKLNRASFNPRRPGGEADVRMWERTLAWFNALEVLRLLQASATVPEFQGKWEVMMNMIKRVGFYTVWVTVINRLGLNGAWTLPPPQQNQTVMALFLAQIPNRFPGTNTANTP